MQEDGSKRTIRGVFRRLKRLGYDVETMWREIGRLVVKTIIAILPELKVGQETEISNVRPGLSCFQVICTTATYAGCILLRCLTGVSLNFEHFRRTLLAIRRPSGSTVASGVVVVVVGVCNRSQMRTSKCTCLIFGMSIGLDPG